MADIQANIGEVKIEHVFQNLQAILDQVGLDSENIQEEEPHCLAFYDTNGKLWQLKECREENNKYVIENPTFNSSKMITGLLQNEESGIMEFADPNDDML